MQITDLYMSMLVHMDRKETHPFFFKSDFGQSIVQNTIELPESTIIGSASIPFTFVTDDAFPLCERIMKPYSPPRGRVLMDEEKNFNYRLSRTRRIVENALGILTAKFICLSGTMFCSPVRAQKTNTP